jgi:hypothetical protein
LGIRISVRISPGARALSKRPTKKSSMAISRVPRGLPGHHLGAVGEHRRGVIVGRVGVGEVPSHRGGVADQRVGDHQGGVAEERVALPHQRRGLEVALAGERADGEVIAALLDVR